MFDEVTRREGGRRAARRGLWVAGSIAVQALLVLAVVAATARIAPPPEAAPLVAVTFVREAAPSPPPPPPPPAPPPAPAAAPRRAPAKPPSETPRAPEPRPAAPAAIVPPPTAVAEAPAPAEPTEAPEEEPRAAGGVEGGGGATGGVAGGASGGVPGGTGPPTGVPGGVADAPVHATAGFTRPREAERGCVARNLHLPGDVLDRVSSGGVTVRFAVLRDGTPAQFQVTSALRDPRVAQVVWRAVQACRWVPGADAQGRPVSIWFILPIRFAVD